MSYVCTIEVYSHFLKVKDIAPNVTYLVRDFCVNLIQYDLQKIKRQFVKKAARVFAAAPSNRSELRFNRNQLDELLYKLEFAGYPKERINLIYMPLYEPKPAAVKLPKTWKARPNQVPIIEYGAGEGHIKVFTLQTGQGKALWEGTPVRIPGGYRAIGNLRPGQQVIGADGTAVTVTGVFPQGIKQLHWVQFGDRKVEACDEHLWSAFINGQWWEVVTTERMRDLLKHGNTVHIPDVSLNGELELREDYEVFVTRTLDDSVGDRLLQLTDITESRRAQAVCISVDALDSLYLVKDDIITHNTSCGLKVGELLSVRMAIVVLGRYFEKWVGDVSSQYGLKPGKLLAVRGYKQLKTVFELVAAGEYSADVIVISSTTMRDYIADWEETMFEGYPDWYIPPDQLWERLGIGFRIIDEAHQHFHLNFKMDLYTHIPKALYLSATLDPDDPFIDRMYRLAYPMATRMSGGSYIKYAKVSAVEYRVKRYDKIRCTGYGGQYSHVEYEKWLMRIPNMVANYCDMIYTLLKSDYLNQRLPGQKALIFAATVDLCKIIRDYIAARVPKDLVVSKYTADEPYEILLNSDISVSTLGSSGTAVDIPKLIVCIMTTSLRDSQANLQALGRLRELHDYPDQIPHFIYLYCADIPKHLEYHRKKVELFSERVINQSVVTVSGQI